VLWPGFASYDRRGEGQGCLWALQYRTILWNLGPTHTPLGAREKRLLAKGTVWVVLRSEDDQVHP
jgi:hypothetical protein